MGLLGSYCLCFLKLIILLIMISVGLCYVWKVFKSDLEKKNESDLNKDKENRQSEKQDGCFGKLTSEYFLIFKYNVPFSILYVVLFSFFSWIFFAIETKYSALEALGYTFSHYFSFPDKTIDDIDFIGSSFSIRFWSASFSIMVSLVLASLPVKYVIKKVEIIVKGIGGIQNSLGNPPSPGGGNDSDKSKDKSLFELMDHVRELIEKEKEKEKKELMIKREREIIEDEIKNLAVIIVEPMDYSNDNKWNDEYKAIYKAMLDHEKVDLMNTEYKNIVEFISRNNRYQFSMMKRIIERYEILRNKIDKLGGK